jgi:rhodanese-related sulfurtransferase
MKANTTLLQGGIMVGTQLKQIIIAGCTTLLLAGVALAAGFKDLSTQEVKAYLDGGQKVLLLNPLSDIEFAENYIPGSVNIPCHLLGSSKELPQDKAAPIITYCLGPKCIFFKLAADELAKMGYTNVMTYKGGIPDWVKAGYPLEQKSTIAPVEIPVINVDELKGLLAGVQVLDVRDPSIYDMGSLTGGIKIPMAKLSAEYAALAKDKPIVVVDHAGKQVISAARFLKSKGYTDVKRLQGGLLAWTEKGYPLDK